MEVELAAPIGPEIAAATTTAAAGRLLALERDGHARIVRAIGDLDAARAEGVLAIVMHHEGAEAIDPGLEALDLWYAAGLRSLGLVWSRTNAFAHGVPFAFPASPDTGPGLTMAGRRLVRRCAELGVAVDLSHLNEAGFWDVAKLDVAPLIASHSGVHALCASTRNLTDAQLDAIAASGGLVGIVFAVPFVRADGADDADTPLETIVAPHPLRGRPHRGRARRARLGLRRRDGARRARRRGRPAEARRRARGRRLHRGRGPRDRLGQLAPRARARLAALTVRTLRRRAHRPDRHRRAVRRPPAGDGADALRRAAGARRRGAGGAWTRCSPTRCSGSWSS